MPVPDRVHQRDVLPGFCELGVLVLATGELGQLLTQLPQSIDNAPGSRTTARWC